jgi:4-amino-4-deoxy-L-arabinose transferase-like glycosyltransferase
VAARLRRSPLTPLLVAVALLVAAWALLVPPFALPDEAPHFGYVQSLAENGERPASVASSGRSFSQEERFALGLARTRAHYLADPVYKPAWEPSAERTWDRHGPGARRDDIAGIGPQRAHPPLYYAYETVPYAAASGGDLFDRLLVMRLWSGALLLVTVAAAWLLVGEVTGRDRLLQLAGAACVGLQPMVTFVSAGVNPDALLFAGYSVVLWLCARLLRRGASPAAVAGLLAATAVTVLTKAAGLALVPGVALVLVLLVRPGLRARAAAGALAAVAVLVALGASATSNLGDRASPDAGASELRGFATYLWDFYLPRLPFQHEYGVLSVDNPAWTVWVKHAWASFGVLEVQFPRPVYVLLAAVAGAMLAGAVAAIARSRFRIDRRLLAVFGLTAACLVAGIHWVDFRQVNEENLRVIQGRYLLPLMPIVAVGVAAALSNLGPRVRRTGVALLLAGLALLQVASLGITAGRYFA